MKLTSPGEARTRLVPMPLMEAHKRVTAASRALRVALEALAAPGISAQEYRRHSQEVDHCHDALEREWEALFAVAHAPGE